MTQTLNAYTPLKSKKIKKFLNKILQNKKSNDIVIKELLNNYNFK